MLIHSYFIESSRKIPEGFRPHLETVLDLSAPLYNGPTRSDLMHKLEDAICFVATPKSEPETTLGYLNFGYYHNGSRGWIESVAVVDAMKKHGIGKQLVWRALATAKAEGLGVVALEAIDEAEGFYKGLGFCEVLETRLEQVVDVKKDISNPVYAFFLNPRSQK